MLSKPAEGQLQQSRLDTWKSIAEYLGRSSRTVQRWHSAYGLPVHHLSGQSGSVYAYSEELDEWLRGRSQNGLAELPEFPAAELHPLGDSNYASDRRNRISKSSVISARAEVRSAELVALAAKLWGFLSYRNLNMIVHYCRKAIDLNPDNPAAYAGLSMGLIAQGIWQLVRPPAAYAGARAALEHALSIDSELPLAKCANAWLKMLVMRDWEGARCGFLELLELAPTSTSSENGRALLCIAEGCLEEAAGLFLRAAQHSPLSSAPVGFYCWTAYLQGRFEDALEQLDEIRASGMNGAITDGLEALASIQLYGKKVQMERLEELAAESPHNDLLCGAIAYAWAVNGQEQRARELLTALTRGTDGTTCRDPYAVALVHIGLNEIQDAVNCLLQSYRNGSVWSLGFQSDPMLRDLRKDPLYLVFLSTCGYPPLP